MKKGDINRRPEKDSLNSQSKGGLRRELTATRWPSRPDKIGFKAIHLTGPDQAKKSLPCLMAKPIRELDLCNTKEINSSHIFMDSHRA